MASQPEEIATGVYRLASRGSNVYFVRSGVSWVLVDAAWAGCGQLIREAAESLFGMDSRPVAIVLTHAHPDHSGALPELARVWEAPIYLHPDEQPFIAPDMAAVEQCPAGPLDRWAIVPLLRVMPRRTREKLLAQGAGLTRLVRPLPLDGAVPGLPEWVSIPTPGHSPGHVALFRPRDRTLIAGDALLTIDLNSLWDLLRGTRRISGPPYISSWRWSVAKASVAALAALDPWTLAPGHGAPLTGSAVAAELHALAAHMTRAEHMQATGQPGHGLRAGRPLAERLLVAVEAFTAVTAIGGGAALLAGREGARFPPELLMGTPFRSYRVPGLLLTGAGGGSAAVAAGVMLRRPDAGAPASIAAGGLLMGWIAGEALILRQPAARSWVEALYFATGLTMVGLGLAVGRNSGRQGRLARQRAAASVPGDLASKAPLVV
jgi:glyoxylase-like metal-dependent hydrolase (beta-lactamase superfamily II)